MPIFAAAAAAAAGAGYAWWTGRGDDDAGGAASGGALAAAKSKAWAIFTPDGGRIARRVDDGKIEVDNSIYKKESGGGNLWVKYGAAIGAALAAVYYINRKI